MTEGLLDRDLERRYLVKPVTVEASHQAADARCAIELGVAALTVGRAPAGEIANLRALMEQAVPLLSDGRFVDVEAYTSLNAAFHTGMVNLAMNQNLIGAYDRLALAGLMVSSLQPDSEVGQEVVDDHRALVEAYEEGNLSRAQRVIIDHNKHAEETCQRAIESAGGQH